MPAFPTSFIIFHNTSKIDLERIRPLLHDLLERSRVPLDIKAIASLNAADVELSIDIDDEGMDGVSVEDYMG